MANYITPEIKATFIDVIGKLREDIGREVIAIGASTTVDCPNCWTGDHLVYTTRGPIPIKDIEVGEYVYGMSGKPQTVVRKISRSYSGKMFRIFPYGNGEGLLVTPEHNLYVYNDGTISRKQAKDINCKDVLITRNNYNFNNDIASVPVEIGESKYGPKQDIPETILLDSDMCWFIGLYLAEGCLKDREIYICLSKDEELEANRVQNILKSKFNINSRLDRRTEEDGNLVVCASSSWLSKFLKRSCGKGAKGKFIPEFMYHTSNENARHMIKGLIFGDGHVDKNQKMSMALISKKIIHGLNMLLKKLNHDFATMGFSPAHMSYGMNKKDTWSIYYYNRPRKISQNIVSGETYSYHKIRKIESIDVDTKVFNIEVNNEHSYYCDGFLSANCSMDPLKKRSTGIYSPTSPYPSGLVTTRYPSGIPAAIDFNATGSRMCPVCLGAGTLETAANRSKIVCMITQLTPEEAALTSLGKNYRRNYELQTSIETKSKFELAQTLLVDGFVSYVTSIEPAGIGDLTQIIVYAGSN